MDMTDQGIRRRLIEQVWAELQKMYTVPVDWRTEDWYLVATHYLRQLKMIEAGPCGYDTDGGGR